MLSLRVSVPPFTERLFGNKEEEVRIPRLRWGGGKNGEGADRNSECLASKGSFHTPPICREQRWPSGSRRQMRDHSVLNPLTD